jgi:transcriptional regulator CtsR
MTTQELIEAYLKTLNDDEKYALEIAQKYLGSTYDLVKSNGFLNWKATL